MKILNPRPIFWACVVLLGALFHASAQDAHWLSNYDKALAQAKASHKDVLLDFTGSDWCPWCIQMEKEVLSTPEFKGYADKNLVLMLVDFPQTKQLPLAVQNQNDTLQTKYAVEGFPSFILVNSKGDVLGKQEGYLDGGPSAFIAKLDSMKK